MHFMKMEGLGNDFIITHGYDDNDIQSMSDSFSRLCDRRLGIGADGLIFVLPSKTADFRMRIFNSDGSEAEMCGNGIRCFARYLTVKELINKNSIDIQTLAGTINVTIQSDTLYKVNMGKPVLKPELIPVKTEKDQQNKYFVMQKVSAADREFEVTAVSMGNPHAVIYQDNLDDELINTYGPVLESHTLFPKRINVEFVKVLSDKEIQMRVYERGCGETQACGTGACAAVVSGIMNKLHGNDITVHLQGGDLEISWAGNENDPVYMSGPAKEVFRGSVSV
ncbi:diaminopimelate epimerase [Cellulosispirillum alkaliphilum]|uniref:diaminopimelate epimerase n=1 Tax=Cellulosispirillum alkaliphilum TaxID=3039283 RepID=UPI003D6F87A7